MSSILEEALSQEIVKIYKFLPNGTVIHGSRKKTLLGVYLEGTDSLVAHLGFKEGKLVNYVFKEKLANEGGVIYSEEELSKGTWHEGSKKEVNRRVDLGSSESSSVFSKDLLRLTDARKGERQYYWN